MDQFSLIIPAHFGWQGLPAPCTGLKRSRGSSPLPEPFLQKRHPFPVEIRMCGPDILKFALEHRGAHPAPHPFEAFFIQGITGDLTPPYVEEDLERPPVPDGRNICLGRMIRILHCGRETCTGERFVPAVPLDGDAFSFSSEPFFYRGQFQVFTAPAIILPWRPVPIHLPPEVLPMKDCLYRKRSDKFKGLGKFHARVHEVGIFESGSPGKFFDCSTVLPA